MKPGVPTSFASKLITPAELARLMDVSDRTIAEWTGGRHGRSRIDYFKVGRVIRFTQESVLKFIFVHTIPAVKSSGAYVPTPKLNQEQFELLCQRIERLLTAAASEPVTVHQVLADGHQVQGNGEKAA